MFKPIHRYDQMHPAAHRFARVPRYGRLLSGLSANELRSITNEAQLFYTVYAKIEESPDAATGILHDGLRRPGFERFGWQNQNPVKGHMYSLWQIRLALDMLGAMAFEIMFGDTPPWNHRDQIRDSIDGDVKQFIEKWADRFLASGAYLNVRGKAIAEECIYADWELLVKANRQVLKHFIFSRVGKESLRFNDISTQAFLAAYWASNYVHDETDRQRLWSCIPDDWLGKRQAYAEFWGFLADMPSSAYHQNQKLAPAKKCWEELLSPVFDQDHPFAPKDDNGKPIRASKLIYYAWDRMQDTAAGRVFRGEFAAILLGVRGLEKQRTAQEMLEGVFRNTWISECTDCVTGASDFVVTRMQEKSPFALEKEWGYRSKSNDQCKQVRLERKDYGVRNKDFELFDDVRACRMEFTMGATREESWGDNYITHLDWYDVICFVYWFGQQSLGDGSIVSVELSRGTQWHYGVLVSNGMFFWSCDLNSSPAQTYSRIGSNRLCLDGKLFLTARSYLPS